MKNKNFVTIKRTFALLTMIAALGLSIAAQDRSGYLIAGHRTGEATTAGGGTLGSGSVTSQMGSGGFVGDGGGGLGSGNRVEDGGSTFGSGNFWDWITSII